MPFGVLFLFQFFEQAHSREVKQSNCVPQSYKKIVRTVFIASQCTENLSVTMSTSMDIPRSRSQNRSYAPLLSPLSSFPSRGGSFRSHILTDDQKSNVLESRSSIRRQNYPETEPLLQRKSDVAVQDEERGRRTDEPVVVPKRFSLVQEVGRQCSLAGPMVCVNLLQYSITIVSIMFVGHLGELELASASIANSLAGVLGYYVLLGMGSALETLCGQAYGASQYHMLGIYLQRAFVVLCITCIPLSFVFLYMENILLLLGQSPEIAEKAGEYALFLLPSLFGYALLQPVVKFLQMQSVVLPMLLCSATTLGLHLGLLYTLIYKLEFGYLGAAIATSLSFCLNGVLLILYVKFSGVCKATWKGFTKEAFVDLPEFLSLAIPSCIMICLEYWCFEILVMSAGLLPNPQLELSGLSVCISTVTLNYMIPFGLSAAASTRVSNELGAGDARAAKLAVYVVMSLSVFQATIISSILLALRYRWGWLFSSEAEVVNYVGTIMPFLACIALLDGIQGVLSGVARGCGWQELGAVINLCAFYGVGVPIALVLAFVFHLGGKGLFIGLICGLGTQMLTLSFFTLRTDWEKQVQIATARVLHDEHEKPEKIDEK